jgi:hypothetical protein
VKTFVKNAFAGLCFVALFLLVSASAQAQVLAHSGDIAGYAGYVHVSDTHHIASLSDNHGIYGVNGGYNITPNITVLGEWNLVPLYSGGGETIRTQLFGGGARFNMMPDKKIVPYGVFNVGYDRLTFSGGGSETVSGYYFGVGGGASCYLGKNWGVRPEFRYVRPEYSSGGESQSFNSIAMTGGVFYQWGGTGTAKKKK